MVELLASTLRLSTPLLFASMGGLLCERSGIATICLEGVMLTAAWSAALVNYYSHSPWLGLIVGMGVGALTMGIHATLCLSQRADHIVSGVAVNLFASGITPFLSKALFGSPTNTPAIPLEERFQPIALPFLSEIPVVGPLLLGQMPLVYLALLLPFLAQLFLFRSGLGLRLYACGESPKALLSAGISPKRVRYLSLLVGGMVGSLGGVYLSISHASQFTRDMTAGRGFIALAALIFGKWKPLPTLVACLVFGFADALQIQLQSTPFFGNTFPVQVIQAMPYVVTLVILVTFIGKARAPEALGVRCE